MKIASKLFVISFLLLSVTVNAQDEKLNQTDANNKKQGHWIKLDEDGKQTYEGNFVNDIPVGKFTYFYDSGTPWSITVFSENGTVSRSQMFDAGGKKTGEGKFVNQKKDSVWNFYDRDGKIISVENYTNGLKNGISIVYYSNGEIAEEKIWKDGVLEGECKKYFETGGLKYKGNYRNDKVEGRATFYHPNGKVNAEGLYENDLKNGEWKFYKEDGTFSRTDVYINGRFKGDSDPNVIPKEQVEKEKRESEQFEIENPYQDR